MRHFLKNGVDEVRRMEVVPHREEWAIRFLEEKKKLKDIFGELALHIYHIGSTAIPNIHAKPVIDIMIEVSDIHKVDQLNEMMEDQGYEAKGENGIANRRYFQKGGDNRTHHVHVFEKGNDEIERHLAFREYMIAHPEEAKRYSELKQQLSKEFLKDPIGYTDGKDAFIKEIDRKAKRYRNGI